MHIKILKLPEKKINNGAVCWIYIFLKPVFFTWNDPHEIIFNIKKSVKSKVSK